MKRIIISDEEKNMIRKMHESFKNKNRVLIEQSDENKELKYIQEFLNQKIKANITVDGKTGPKTNEAISNYQSSIGVYPADGVWGYETQKKMPPQDKKMLEDIKSKGSFFGGLFGN